ncbi:MAG: hypothetical protein K2Y18_03585 [Alphaproteobacteria bacterium]|jgi:hypothetical protein|nr:hypothetical protein [Alphaproteobacteria bacterium]
MIQILPLDGTPPECFEDFDELFKSVTSIENSKLMATCPDFTYMNWSFIILSPKRVTALYGHIKEPSAEILEAFEDNLPLIEICAGDYQKPQYIVLTPNVDMDYLKRKWCIDYCTYHHLLVREL